MEEEYTEIEEDLSGFEEAEADDYKIDWLGTQDDLNFYLG